MSATRKPDLADAVARLVEDRVHVECSRYFYPEYPVIVRCPREVAVAIIALVCEALVPPGKEEEVA